MDADEPSAAEPQPQRYGVRGLVRAFGRRVVAVECGTVSKSPGPLDAALLWRQVAKAAKAVTSHRTPNSLRLRRRPGQRRLGRLMRLGHLFGAQLLLEYRLEVGRIRVAVRGGERDPLAGLHQILGDAVAFGITHAERIFGLGLLLRGGF